MQTGGYGRWVGGTFSVTRTKIKDIDDSEFVQQDLNLLMEWSKKWLLSFNMDKCKVMLIGHKLPTVYTISDGNSMVCLETITVEKDLGVWMRMTKDLKPTEQWIQATKNAQSVLGMINRHFKTIDKEDFGIIYKTYVRPHLEYCVQTWAPQLQKDKKCLEKVQRRQPEWSKNSRNFHIRLC